MRLMTSVHDDDNEEENVDDNTGYSSKPLLLLTQRGHHWRLNSQPILLLVVLSMVTLIVGWNIVMGSFDSSSSSSFNNNDDNDATAGQTRQEEPLSSSLPSPPLVVTIVGAGVAGMSAAYALHQAGMDDFVILEASDRIGGRIRKADDTTTSFVDQFPLELGATVVNDPDTMNQISHSQVMYTQIPGDELAFYNYSYIDFFTDHVVPKFNGGRKNNKIMLGCQVNLVQYEDSSSSRLNKVTCVDGRTFWSEHTIVTASLQVLKDGDITFVPPLPTKLVDQHPGVMWQGIKIFVQFSEKWFADQIFCLVDCPAETDHGESYFWDYTPIPNKHILAGLLMGDPYEKVLQKNTKIHENIEDELIQDLLVRMENKFHKPISQYYVNHLIFNWTAQPFVRGTYSSMGLQGPHNIPNKVFLAGEAYPANNVDDSGWVHTAFNSGKATAEIILSLTWPQNKKKKRKGGKTKKKRPITARP